jgi:hypothetical protein
MFGHQDDQHHHHDGDNHQLNDAAMQPAVESVLSTDEHGGTTMQDDQQHQDFNPALPPSDVPTAPEAPAQTDAPSANSDLLSIKQQALTALSPLVGHLDQAPEEKFRTTMMLIQASDNHEMISEAYAAAQQITDEKVKAQALLDVVNEINYFTQQTAAA